MNIQRLVFMEPKYDHKTYSEGVYDTKSITFEYSKTFQIWRDSFLYLHDANSFTI